MHEAFADNCREIFPVMMRYIIWFDHFVSCPWLTRAACATIWHKNQSTYIWISNDLDTGLLIFRCLILFSSFNSLGIEFRRNQARQTISTGELHALLHFHPQPINVVVFHGLSGKINLENCLALRCFQRLSVPHLATRPCSWQNNRSTRGASNPVLSY